MILALFQVGGLGIMTGATLLGLLVARRLRLSTRLVAQAETRSLGLGDVVGVLRLVLSVTVGVELVTAAVLALRLRYAYGEAWADAVWNGVFLAVASFSNAGFSTYSDNLVSFAADPFILGPIMAGRDPGRHRLPGAPRHPPEPAAGRRDGRCTPSSPCSAPACCCSAARRPCWLYEWSNPATLGPLDPADKLLGAVFHSAMTRSGGFNALDIGQMQPETLAVSYVLMMIGGGSASTAGGIKVTTFLVLGFVVWAEIRGEPDVTAFGRRISREVQRQALTIALLAVGLRRAWAPSSS